MAKKKAKSSLTGKLGKAGQKAVESHRTDDTTYSGAGDLPDGIDGGIAQLVDCKFDTYKKGDNTGEYYYYQAGVVVSPKEHGGIHIEGLRTSVTEPMCNTPNRTRQDVDAHVEWVLNELRKLGAETGEMGIDDLEAAAEALKEEQPHFRFRTWKGDKQTEGPYKDVEPRVNHEWRGACEYGGEDDDGVVDETASDAEEPAPDEKPDEDLTALAERADAEDEEAQTVLTEKAGALDINPDSPEYKTWADVAAAIESSSEGTGEKGEEDDEEEEEEEEESQPPEKGEVYSFKPPKKKKPVECEVTTVFPKKETCNLKSLDDGKIFKAVKWDRLEEVE